MTRLSPITRYWLRHYVDPETKLCTLCGNTGTIDTRESAVSAAGVRSGSRVCCICPNGQAMRESATHHGRGEKREA